jgi:hypothetical protein
MSESKQEVSMIKKTLFVFFAVTFALTSNAQFFNSWGIMGGGTLAKQKFNYKEPDVTQKKKNLLGFNVELFAEFFTNDNFTWRTELEYNKKGCVDKDSGNFKNKLTYISWNNYLKMRTDLFGGTPYLLLGPKLEYMSSQGTSSPHITGAFNKFQLSPDVALGWEFVVFTNVKPTIELHYNPDIGLNAYKDSNLGIMNSAWELRLGLRFASARESCPRVYK